jgi:methylated-DNA-[protein]-cysteine S-methyltransferase
VADTEIQPDPVPLVIAVLASPLGHLHVAVRDGVICALAFDDWWPNERRRLERRFPGMSLAAGDGGDVRLALERYLAGDLHAIEALAVDPGGTAFQAAVWQALRRIPAGETRSYAELARAVGVPSAVRAVAAANGRNPVAIVVPCHRVIGSDGRLVGYGGGLDRKAWLLRHERAARGRWAEATLFD